MLMPHTYNHLPRSWIRTLLFWVDRSLCIFSLNRTVLDHTRRCIGSSYTSIVHHRYASATFCTFQRTARAQGLGIYMRKFWSTSRSHNSINVGLIEISNASLWSWDVVLSFGVASISFRYREGQQKGQKKIEVVLGFEPRSPVIFWNIDHFKNQCAHHYTIQPNLVLLDYYLVYTVTQNWGIHLSSISSDLRRNAADNGSL